jgi:hypothetical protein
MGNSKAQALRVDLSDRAEGVFDVDVPVNQIDLPQGVRILSVRPNLVRVEVVKTQ